MSTEAHTPAVSPNPDAPDRNLAMELVRVTEAAALASGKWVGRGQKAVSYTHLTLPTSDLV